MAKDVVCKLNTTRNSRDRYYVVKGGQGNYGLPKHYPDHSYGLVAGVDRGNGYQEYTSITYCLKECDWFPKEARDNLIYFLHRHGYNAYLIEMGIIESVKDMGVKV